MSFVWPQRSKFFPPKLLKMIDLVIDNERYCSMKYLRATIVTFLFFPTLVMSVGVPSGWKMTDRFIGFRFELVPSATLGDNVKSAIRGETMRA